jgi:hypothetical protein
MVEREVHHTAADYIINESNATVNNAGKESITTFNHEKKIYSISHGKISS